MRCDLYHDKGICRYVGVRFRTFGGRYGQRGRLPGECPKAARRPETPRGVWGKWGGMLSTVRQCAYAGLVVAGGLFFQQGIDCAHVFFGQCADGGFQAQLGK